MPDFPPLADVRLFLSPRTIKGFDRAPQVDVGVMRFGGWQIHPVPAPDYTEDAYLVRATVDLALEPGFGGPRWAEAGFAFEAAEASVLDAVPLAVRAAEPSRAYRLDPRLNFVPAPPDSDGDRVVSLGPQEPLTEAFGVGSPQLRWRWTAPDPGGIAAGMRGGWFVLLVTAGRREIRVRPTARYLLSAVDADGLQPKSEPVERMVTLPVPVRGFAGAAKLEVIRRIGQSWRDLSDILGIEGYERARFVPGDEPRDLWQWLDERGRLAELPDALEAIGRRDLTELLTR